jgi:hypothetical protein
VSGTHQAPPAWTVVLQVSNRNRFVPERLFVRSLGCQIEEAVDELNLTKKIISCDPSTLPLPNHMNCFACLRKAFRR